MSASNFVESQCRELKNIMTGQAQIHYHIRVHINWFCGAINHYYCWTLNVYGYLILLIADRGDVQKGSAEIFFRKVKFWNEDDQEEAPPVFVGITFLNQAAHFKLPLSDGTDSTIWIFYPENFLEMS